MYGKAFESMYTGSMVGAGLNVWGVWNYIIANTHFGVIEINPPLLAFILGCTTKEVEAAVAKLMAPDPHSRSKSESGRRILKESQFGYRVVNWEHYQKLRNAESKRQYDRERQSAFRKKKKGGPSPGEGIHERAMGRGDQKTADTVTDPDYLHEQPAPYG